MIKVFHLLEHEQQQQQFRYLFKSRDSLHRGLLRSLRKAEKSRMSMNLLLICLEKSLVYSQNRQLRLEEFIYLGSEWEGNGLCQTPKQIKIESKRPSHCRINHSARARINHRNLALAREAMLSQVLASYEVHRNALTSSASCRHFMTLGSAKTKMKL